MRNESKSRMGKLPHIRISPKAVLITVIGIAATGTMLYYGITHQSVQYSDFPAELLLVAPSEHNRFDCSALEDILNQRDETVTPNERKSAMKDNISLILYMNEFNELVPTGSATMISKGGYFITVAHTIENLLDSAKVKGVYIFNLSTNRIYFARDVIFDNEHDAAIVYAPTGQPHSPIRGIEFRRDEIKNGEELELIGVSLTDYGGILKYAILRSSGKLTDPSVLEKPFYVDGKELSFGASRGALVVEGMKPFGGGSGGSISDRIGRFVALESGAYGGLRIRDYKGATVTPVGFLNNLIKECPVQRLP